MKSTSFRIKNIPSPIDNKQNFSIPLLNAYAIEYSMLNVNGQSIFVDGNGLEIINHNIIWHSDPLYSYEIGTTWSVVLEIFYHGVRDFALFFPQIKANDSSLAERLGEFYEES